MSDEPNAVTAPVVPPVEAPVTPPPPRMTESDFIGELSSLLKRAEDAGLNSIALVTRVVFRRGVSILDGIFASVEKDLGSGIGKKG